MSLRDRFRDWGDALRANLFTLLAALVIIGVLLGYVVFVSANITPELAKRDKLSVQLNDARRALIEARKIPESKPSDMQTRIAESKATLSAAVNVFLTDPQAKEVIAALYQYASASSVAITSLQTQPPSTPGPKDIFRVTALKLQVQGPSRNLVDFVSRIKEAALRSVVITNLNLVGGEAQNATLTMELSLYTFSPTFAEAVFASPTLTATVPATQTRPSPFPVFTPIPFASSTPLPAATFTPLIIFLPTLTFTPPPALSPTATPSPTPFSSYRYTHTVVAGDTLFAIARRYGTSVEAIMQANNLPNTNIRVGQQLLIP